MSCPVHCPKCQGLFEPGFMVDRSEMYLPVEGEWASGEPNRKPSFWSGGVLKKTTRTLPVTAVRCSRCGYLECYAREAAD